MLLGANSFNKPPFRSRRGGLTAESAAARQAGFDSVRIPIRWSAHASTAAPYVSMPFQISPNVPK
jgi:hypothetical protein